MNLSGALKLGRHALRVALVAGGLVAAASIPSTAFAYATWYVSPNGQDNALGWKASPKKTIQAGIDTARSGDKVYVAPGTYSGKGNTEINFKGKDVRVIAMFPQQAPSIIDGSGSNGPAFVFQSRESRAALLDGFTIQNTSNNGSYWSQGGAVTIAGASPTIQNCIFKSCNVSTTRGGAAIYNGGGGPLIANCRFENCTASNPQADGGAILSLSIQSTLTTEITNCTFRGNSAPQEGGAIASMGMGLTQMTRCAFEANRAGQHGGAILACSSVFIFSSSFLGNSAGFLGDSGGIGGAIFCTNTDGPGSLLITSSAFVRNRSERQGGAISAFSGNTLISHCTLVDNETQNFGGGIDTAAPLSITNSILYGNRLTAPNRRGFNQIGVNIHSRPSVTIERSNIQGGGYQASLGNIDADPRFVQNPGSATAPYGDLRLQSGSPCIDTGTTTGAPFLITLILSPTDLAGLTRLYGRAPDMGVYEMQPGNW